MAFERRPFSFLIMQENYIYHIVPRPFEGPKLIPLNRMDKQSELYKKNFSKYVGRECLTKQVIPLLNCLWNDVVQFSAIDPCLVAKEIKSLGGLNRSLELEVFKIPISHVVGVNKVVSYTKTVSSNRSFELLASDFSFTTVENYQEQKTIPLTTINYWKDAIKEERPVLWFPYITHIFVLGEVETSQLERISLKI
ncbi:hypothetical protein [Halobacteriovorax sp. HLS]|uniref:hypothetical protein n=1 Tax=Halobacteriovorax sp. HLS TaxID=2234000 RepID=UPI000FDAB0F8|nr:hypothetical protein [Halobacteriovorax sp. HLS]